METVIIVIMLLVSVSCLLKLTYLPLWGRVTVCAILAIVTGASWTFAVTQSKTQIAGWLQSPELMLDMAVLLTIDVLMQMAFCITGGARLMGDKLTRAERAIHAVTLWVPGLLIFPTLLALLVEVIFSFPGSDFAAVAWMLAGGVMLTGLVMSYLLKAILPENDLRLELIFMVNALTALLGVVATVNGRTAVAGVDTVDWAILAGVMGLLAIGAAAGFIMFKHKQHKSLSHK